MAKIKDITSFLEILAPPAYQESYDNSGLLVGNPDQQVSKILVTLDVTEDVVEEAIKEKANLIIAHHPVIFKGLKRLTGSNYVERTVIKAIKNDVAIYAIHTNLDNVSNGVNKKIADKLGLVNTSILSPKPGLLKKLVTFIPVQHTDEVLDAVFKSGAGKIGNYSECSFRIQGKGTFRPDQEANPYLGEAGKLEFADEVRAELIFPAYLQNKVIKALTEAHPYEEPAFDVFSMDNTDPYTGSGMIGELQENLSEKEFLNRVKERLEVPLIRHTKFTGKPVEKVAVCGGSGSFLLKDAIAKKADIFITSDFKYHEFFDAENKILIADVGHYESEVHTKELVYEYLIQKFSNIAVILAKTVTNPISYL